MFVEPEGCGQPGYCNPDAHFSYRQSPAGTKASPTSPSAHACRACNRLVKPQKMTARVELAWTALPDDLISRLRMLRAWYLRYEEVNDLIFVDKERVR